MIRGDGEPRLTIDQRKDLVEQQKIISAFNRFRLRQGPSMLFDLQFGSINEADEFFLELDQLLEKLKILKIPELVECINERFKNPRDMDTFTFKRALAAVTEILHNKFSQFMQEIKLP